MEETPVIKEFPVRRPATVQENAFFYYEKNRAYLLGSVDQPYPIISHPDSDESNLFKVVVLILGILLFFLLQYESSLWVWLPGLIGMCVIVMSRVNRRRNRLLTERLLREGHFLIGKLVSSTASQEGWGRSRTFYVEARYEFVSPQGTTLQGVEKKPRPDLSGKQLPTPSTPVYVLYFSDAEFYLL